MKNKGNNKRFSSFRRPGMHAQPVLPLREQVAAKILRRQAKRIGRKLFVEFDGQKLTYREANDRANRVANAFSALGAEKGARVAILLRNRLEYLDLWFGLSKIGAVQVPLNTEYKSGQLLHVLRRAPVRYIVTEAAFGDELAKAVEQTDGQIKVLQLSVSPALKNSEHIELLSYQNCVASADSREPDDALVSGSDIGAIMNTSGTTGPSKGVQLSHAQQFILGRNIAADLGLMSADVYYNFFPLFHNTAQAMITLPVLLAGARMVLKEKFSATRFWPDVKAHKCTSFYYIGEILRILLKTAAPDYAAHSPLRIGWGIGAAPGDFVEFQKKFKLKLRSGYGSTEANVPCFLPRGRYKPGSVGSVISGFEVRVADEHGLALKEVQAGVILVRSSEPYAVMMGYDGDPEATVAAWRDLWFHTGDAGYMDSDGELFFTGRVKDVIRVRGENVSAFEIEEVISELPVVLEVAAIAVPCDLGGDDIKIVIVARAGSAIEFSSIIEHAQTKLPRHCVPRYIEVVEALPKTETNKVKKNVLRSTPFTAATWDRQALGIR